MKNLLMNCKLKPGDADFAFYIEKRGYTVDDIEEKGERLDRLRNEYTGIKEEEISDASSNEDEVEVKEIETTGVTSLP
ncbi:3961_t:CDS:2 [Ambispora leptoticha]|uniref:3961_t:CDS:1 n=1 Tax=Ambispora leptoticha TaxID=144679 RepID=A0A9N8V748_9GLOM|nr:3961_t:CDS:2 [Ambispora leptoticha]